MASLEKRVASNAAGDFFVDDSCIDCGMCRWLAPDTFDLDQALELSRVYRQPATEEELKLGLMALIGCPTASIGTVQKHNLLPVIGSFPTRIEDNVYYCGFHSEASFGATSYLIVRERGNVLVDSPRFTKSLVARIEAMGGVQTMFLTHRDDVADHRKFRGHFHCERILHRDDVTQATRELEVQPSGNDPVQLDTDLLLIPTPGHTRGSACLLYDQKYLFTGDHAAWSRRLGQIYAFRDACWYDWNVLRTSMQRLAEHSFEWMLPGHGERCHFARAEMSAQMRRCLDWLAST